MWAGGVWTLAGNYYKCDCGKGHFSWRKMCAFSPEPPNFEGLKGSKEDMCGWLRSNRTERHSAMAGSSSASNGREVRGAEGGRRNPARRKTWAVERGRCQDLISGGKHEAEKSQASGNNKLCDRVESGENQEGRRHHPRTQITIRVRGKLSQKPKSLLT